MTKTNICLNLQNVSVKGVAYIPSTAKLMNGFYAPFYKQKREMNNAIYDAMQELYVIALDIEYLAELNESEVLKHKATRMLELLDKISDEHDSERPNHQLFFLN